MVNPMQMRARAGYLALCAACLMLAGTAAHSQNANQHAGKGTAAAKRPANARPNPAPLPELIGFAGDSDNKRVSQTTESAVGESVALKIGGSLPADFKPTTRITLVDKPDKPLSVTADYDP